MQVHDLDMQDAHGVTTRFLCTLRAWSGTLEIEVPTWISFKSGRLLLESDNSTVCVKCCITVHCLSRFNCQQLLHDPNLIVYRATLPQARGLQAYNIHVLAGFARIASARSYR